MDGCDPVPDERTLEVISPNLPIDAAIEYVEPPGDVGVEDVRLVGQPKFLFECDVTLKRRLFPDRDVGLSITVDAVTGGRYRNDVYPPLETRTLPTSALIEPRFPRDEALERAKSNVRRHISYHYSSYVMLFNVPEIDVVRDDFVYELYWLVPETPAATTVTVINTVNGKIGGSDVDLDAADVAETTA